MTYEVTVRNVDAQPVASVRVTIKPAEIGDTLGGLLAQIRQYLQGQGIAPAGPPFSRSHTYSSEAVDLEAGYPVEQPVDGEGRIAASQLPGGPVAATWHMGPYNKIQRAYDALGAWMAEQDREPSGAPWEVYWTGPGAEPDSAKWKTEIVWPID
jgi:effector-binding domain-containing protein